MNDVPSTAADDDVAEKVADDASTPEVLSPSAEALASSIQTVWRIKWAAALTAIVLAVLFYDLAHLFDDSAWLPFGVLTGGVAVLGGLFCWTWPRLQYAAWGMALRPEELYLEHGVVNHVRTIVPLRRIQHLDVSQDLLEREFALGRLVVHTAGSRSSDVVIPGLPLEKAEDIRDEVKRFILEDPLMEDPV